MKAPLVIIIVIVVAIIGFLTVYSQQRDVTTQAQQGRTAGYGSAPAADSGGSAPAAGGTGSASAVAGSGGQQAAPAAVGYGK